MATIETAFTKEGLLHGLSPKNLFPRLRVSWDNDEEIMCELTGGSVQTTYNEEILKTTSKTAEHEYFIEFIKRIVDRLSIFLRIKIIFFGSPTIKQSVNKKGIEPDACFYVSRAGLVSGRTKIDLAENVPDIVVEVDFAHYSDEKFEIYAAFGVPEFWFYDEETLKIYRLENKVYQEVTMSIELPFLSAEVLTEFLTRSKTEDQFDLLIDFEKQLRNNKL